MVNPMAVVIDRFAGKMRPILIKMHDSQRDYIDQAAQSTGVSRSEFLRAHALAAAREILDKETNTAA